MFHLMLGHQLGEETLPVLGVIVDQEEALHVYVGQHPLVRAESHVGVRLCRRTLKEGFMDGSMFHVSTSLK